jgi:hypothetical protein
VNATPADALTSRENIVLLSLIRQGIRKSRRNRENGKRRWGEHYNSAQQDSKQEVLESLYVKFGGDPARITYHEESL